MAIGGWRLSPRLHPASRAETRCLAAVALIVAAVGLMAPAIAEARVRVLPAGDPDAVPLFVIAGGPGQSAVALANDLERLLRPVAPQRTLVLVERPGTGPGSPRCRGLTATGSRLSGAAARCARRLGAGRDRLLTPDAVRELERVRALFGFDRIDIYAVSYGSREALAYADAYPGRVRRIVLDSPVPVTGPDPFLRSSLRALPGVLVAHCRQRCLGGRRAPVRDLARYVTALAAGGDPAARRRSALLRLLLASEADPLLRRRLPVALQAAGSGDGRRLNGLLRRAAGSGVPPGAFNAATNAAVVCEELNLPWSRGAGPERRARQLRRVLRAIPRRQLFPFDRVTLFAAPVFELCRRWPHRSAGSPPAPRPDARTLVLAGGRDLLTPATDSRRLAARLPGAHLVLAPNAGHTVLAHLKADSRLARRIHSFLSA